jgi:glucose-6-phosphate isomerase
MKLHYGRMLTDNLDGQHGLTRGRLAELVHRFPTVQAEVETRRSQGEYGFHNLGQQTDVIRGIRRFAEGVGQAYDHVVVLGIGGSALGAKALVNALRPPAWNEMSDEEREYFPRITVLENIDPTSIGAALKRIDPRRVFVNVISKSGGTAETAAQYLVVRGGSIKPSDRMQRPATSRSRPIPSTVRFESWLARKGSPPWKFRRTSGAVTVSSPRWDCCRQR